MTEHQDPAVTEARASGQLADQSRRHAEKAEALGFTEQAKDHRNRQDNMTSHLRDQADAEDRSRSRSRRRR